MSKHAAGKTVALAALGALAISVGCWDLAQSYAHPSSPPSKAASGAGSSVAWSARQRASPSPAANLDLRLSREKHVSLAQAIAAATGSQGSAIDAFLATDAGKPVYHVRVLANNAAIVTDSVDAATGKVTADLSVLPAARWSAFDRQEVANSKNSSVSLGGAISLAMAKHPARIAIAAAASDARDKLGYRIDLIRDGLVDRMAVRPNQAEAMAHPAKTPPAA